VTGVLNAIPFQKMGRSAKIASSLTPKKKKKKMIRLTIEVEATTIAELLYLFECASEMVKDSLGDISSSILCGSATDLTGSANFYITFEES
jgi:hypothetical protein